MGDDLKPRWEGDLEDDCTADWCGLMLRAESMDENHWWWAVSENSTGREIDSSNNHNERVSSGNKARAAAEIAARKFLGPNFEII